MPTRPEPFPIENATQAVIFVGILLIAWGWRWLDGKAC